MNKEKIFKWVSLGLSLLCLSGALICYQGISLVSNRASMQLDDTELKLLNAKEKLEAEVESESGLPVVFYYVNKNVLIRGESLQKKTKGTVIKVCGDVSVLINGMGNLVPDDEEGCLISSSLAEKIFGSSKVINKKLSLEEEVYTIRGVFKNKQEQFLCLGKGEQTFERVSVKVYDNKLASEVISEFCERNALTGTVIEWVVLQGVVKSFILLVALTWALILVKPKNKYVKLAYVLILVAFVVLQIRLPREMVPVKFSDFSFWSKWWQTGKMYLENVLLMEKVGYERDVLFLAIKGIGLSVFAFIGGLVNHRLCS